MSKEMFVSLTPHETKVAVNEEDLLAEVYFERENEYTLAGSIYKGRVTRVLPACSPRLSISAWNATRSSTFPISSTSKKRKTNRWNLSARNMHANRVRLTARSA